MAYEMSDETKERLAQIHEEIKEHAESGKAIKFTGSPNYSVVYWDDETDHWLFGSQDQYEGWSAFPMEEFPKGMEIIYSWDEYEVVSIESTKLYHGTYGLDPVREDGA